MCGGPCQKKTPTVGGERTVVPTHRLRPSEGENLKKTPGGTEPGGRTQAKWVHKRCRGSNTEGTAPKGAPGVKDGAGRESTRRFRTLQHQGIRDEEKKNLKGKKTSQKEKGTLGRAWRWSWQFEPKVGPNERKGFFFGMKEKSCRVWGKGRVAQVPGNARKRERRPKTKKKKVYRGKKRERSGGGEGEGGTAPGHGSANTCSETREDPGGVNQGNS